MSNNLTASELSAKTNIPASTLYRWAERGLIGQRKGGTTKRAGQWWFTGKDVKIVKGFRKCSHVIKFSGK